MCASSGERSESELLARSLRGLDSCLSFMGVLPLRFCRGVWPPSNLREEEEEEKKKELKLNYTFPRGQNQNFILNSSFCETCLNLNVLDKYIKNVPVMPLFNC